MRCPFQSPIPPPQLFLGILSIFDQNTNTVPRTQDLTDQISFLFQKLRKKKKYSATAVSIQHT